MLPVPLFDGEQHGIRSDVDHRLSHPRSVHLELRWQNGCVARLLGIDVGTSGAKALLIDETGKVLRSASAEYPLSTPRPLWREQDPEDWWKRVESCISDIGEQEPDAIGLTGQMHGAVFLDRRGAVIRPAILWNDQRTAEECAEIDRMIGKARFREITCNPPLTGFQAPKILWLRKHEPQHFAQIRSVLLPKDYIRFRLSGEMASDVSDASGTALFDVPNRKWSMEILEKLALDPEWFPRVDESWMVGCCTRVSECLEAGVPIVAGGGDQAAGAVGTGAVEPGIVSVSLGTSGVVFTSLDSPQYDPTGAAHTFCHANGAWHAMGVMLSCGGSLRWHRDTFGMGKSYDELAALAERVEVGSEGLTFLPYMSGERTPHHDPAARGAFVGATLSHSPSHFARAVFEGASFGLMDGMEVLKELGAQADEIRVTGGGAKSGFWVQMLAELFGKTCRTLEVDEGPAFGAALLAGVGAGVWPSVNAACKAAVRFKSRYEPSNVNYSKAYRRFRDLYPALKDWFASI